jgi:AraC-like DNA-binding protein
VGLFLWSKKVIRHQYEQLCESSTDRLLQGKAHLYATRFHAAEQQQEIEQQKIAHRHVCIVALCIGIAALIAVLFAVFALRQRRREQQKNQVLVKQISETLDYKKMYEHLKYADSTAPEPSPSVAQAGVTDLAALSNADLFGYLSEVIIRERMYLDPAFERQTLADRFHLSDHRLGTAFSQGSSYKSLPDFIRCLRLEYACELLRERPDLTVSEVANQSGFSNLTVFSRCFKAKYMMAPSVFRNS